MSDPFTWTKIVLIVLLPSTRAGTPDILVSGIPCIGPIGVVLANMRASELSMVTAVAAKVSLTY